MKLRTVIWDWNGTLLNDAFVCRDVMNQLLKHRNLPQMSAKKYQSIFDFPVHVYYEKLGFDYTVDTFESLGTEFINAYEKRRHECRLQPGARELIRFIKSKNIQQAILSAYRHDTLVSLLQNKGLADCFNWIVGADDHYARGKIAQGKRLMKTIRGTKHDAIMIGDTVHDSEVAEAIGIPCLLVYAGHQSRERLQRDKRIVMNNLAEIKQWILKSL
jgi:phosphoglycolate phosphatase